MKAGNILLTFVLLIALSAIVLSFLYLVSHRYRNIAFEQDRMAALYIAEAGVDKALWYLITPAGQGGRGGAWRTTGTAETYSSGQFTISVEDGASASEVLITSTGEVHQIKRTVQVRMSASTLPAAFDYAVFNNGNLTLKGSMSISGDVFSNGNMIIDSPAAVTGGEVSTPLSFSVSGSGTYTVGPAPDPLPTMPYLDTTYYDTKISIAGSQPPSSETLSNYNLGGSTIYVNGNVTVSGNLIGGGIIVATGTINIQGASVDPNTTFISNGALTISSTANIQGDSIIYSGTNVSIPGNSRVDGSILSSSVIIAGTPTIHGIIYSWDLSVDVVGTANVYGSIVNPSSKTYTGNISVVYDESYIPATVPPGLQASGFHLVKGSWKEL